MIKTNEDFAREIAKEYNISIFVAKQVIDSPFRFLKSIMEKKQFEGLMLPYLGKFGVNPKVKDFMIKYNESKIKGDSQGSVQ